MPAGCVHKNLAVGEPMRDLEKYYGIKLAKRVSLARMLNRSERTKARQKADGMLKEANALFVGGFYDQCFGVLENAVRLVPSDPRPFYVLGLIHEERQCYRKAQMSYFISALLKKSDTSMWRKVLSTSLMLDDGKKQAMALERIYRREPSEGLLVKRLECLKKLNKKYWVIGCEIEMFDYQGVDNGIFDKFKDTNHVLEIKRLCKRLLKCIARNEDARTEYFLRHTIYNLYKLRDWKSILDLMRRYYMKVCAQPAPEIRAIYCTAVAYTECRRTVGAGGVADSTNNTVDIDSTDNMTDSNKSMNEMVEQGGSEGRAKDIMIDIESIENLSEGEDITDLIEEKYVANLVESIMNEEREAEDKEAAGMPSGMQYRNDGSSVQDTAMGLPSGEPRSMPKELASLIADRKTVKNLTDDIIADDHFWGDLKDEKYIDDLADCLQEGGMADQAVALLERLLTKNACVKTTMKIADFYLRKGDGEKALECYHDVLAEEPMNMQVKSQLYEIYQGMGEPELAKEYETTMQAYRYAEAQEKETKSSHRYSFRRCCALRRLYERANRVLDADGSKYAEHTHELLDDFFGNKFVTARKKSFRSFLNRYERVKGEIVPAEKGLGKHKMTEKLIRVSSLHGLDTEEWFYTLSNTVVCHMQANRLDEAKALIERGMAAYVFHDPRFMTQLHLLGLRAALLLSDFELVVRVVRSVSEYHGQTAAYLLYFLCNFVPGFYRYTSFGNFQKNMQRVSRRMVNEGTPVPPFMHLSAYVPRHLFTPTVDFLAAIAQESRRVDSRVLACSIYLTHTKSRTLVDKMKYAQAGIRLLRDAEGGAAIRHYNLGKAYHFYGYYGQAEKYYLMAIAEGSEELKKMSVFNLSLIFKKNKSKKVLSHLISKV